jgi:hypothetical protein
MENEDTIDYDYEHDCPYYQVVEDTPYDQFWSLAGIAVVILSIGIAWALVIWAGSLVR